MSPDKLEITADTDEVAVEVDVEEPAIDITVNDFPDTVVSGPQVQELNIDVTLEEEIGLEIRETFPDTAVLVQESSPDVIVIPQGYRGPPGPEGDPGPMGPKGDTGPPGEKSTTVFTQNTPSVTWFVNHNLNCYPAVTVIDSGDNELIPDLIYLDLNNLQISFANPTSGKVYLN